MTSIELEKYFSIERSLIKGLTLFLRNHPTSSEEEWNELFNLIIDQLKNRPDWKIKFSHEVKNLLALDGLSDLLSTSNIHHQSTFWQEFTSKLRTSIIPRLRNENPFRFRIRRVFDFDQDAIWLQKISIQQISQIRSLLEHQISTQELKTNVWHAVRVVSHKIAALGIENRMNIRHQDEKIHHAIFMSVPVQAESFLIAATESDREQKKDLLRFTLDKCSRYLLDVMAAAEIQGTDIQKTFLVTKTNELIGRLENLINLIQPGNQDADTALHHVLKDLVEEEYSSQDFSYFIKSNLKSLSLRVSEHTSHTGEHYIAENAKEYRQFMFAALGAGFIVSILVFFKAWLHKVGFPPIWEGLAYSLNYVLGFVLIQVFHFTLATKQPAMTASAIARSIDSKDGKPNFAELAITIVRVVHTQTISFIGNLLIVFPLPFIFAWLLDLGFGYKLYSPEKAIGVIENQHPWLSGSLWFAAITGIFLFMSGIIAGYCDNRMIFSRIPERIRQMKNLHRFLGFKRTIALSKYLDQNAGSLAGNISLGFFLGFATFIGEITGFPFDIRHITFAAGTFTSALYSAGSVVPLNEILIVFFGILFIGFINFAVSFGLAFYFACKSRGVSIRKTPEIFTFLRKYLKKYPQDLFTAPRHPRKPEDLL